MSDRPSAPSHASAERATCQAFLNCYLREIDGGRLAEGSPPRLELSLPEAGVELRVALDYRSPTGANRFGTIELRRGDADPWRQAEPMDVLPLLVQSCFRGAQGPSGQKRAELLRSVLNSYAEIERICRLRPSGLGEDFLAAEQSLVFGHALHPTPKSREGMADWHQPAYAPELGGRFQLQYFAVADRVLRAGSALDRPATALVAELPGLEGAFDLAPGEALIPAHPLQAEALRLRRDVQALLASGELRDLGAAGAHFYPTSSLRTVYAPDSPWMLKFSLPVQVTNSRRINQLHELEAGMLMAVLLSRLGVGRRGARLRVLDDPAWLAVAGPGGREGGFEMIFRENPFRGDAARGQVNLATLTAEPPPREESRLVRTLHRLGPPRLAAARWFEAYLDCVLEPMLDLYEAHGIALEAHQQNTLLDLAEGLPRRAWYRDNQGYYIAERHFDRLAELVPGLRETQELCYPQGEINDRLAYYLIVNQIFGVIGRLGRDGLGEEGAFLDRLAGRLCRHADRPGTGGDFARHVLRASSLMTKANLLTRAQDIDELSDATSIYIGLPNPLAARRNATSARQADVVA